MGAFYGADPEAWIREFQMMHAAAQRANAARDIAWNPDKAQRAAAITRSAPWLEPGAILALAKGTTTMEPVRAAATVSGARRARINPTNRRPGERVEAASLFPGDRRLFDSTRSPRAAEAEALGGRSIEGVMEDFRRGEPGQVEPGQLIGREREMAYNARQPVGREREQQYFTEVYPDLPSEIKEARAAGLLSGEGIISVPEGKRTFDRKAGQWVYENDRARQQWGVFERLVNHVSQGSEEMREFVPVRRGNKPALYSIESQIITEDTEQDLHADAGIPGLVASGLGAIGSGLDETIGNRRLPDPLGMRRRSPGPQAGGVTTPREAVQAGFMALNMPLQEATGLIRTAAGHGGLSGTWQPQSDYMITMTENMEPGDGLFVDPDSEVAHERRDRERAQGTINGEIITIGRLAAGALANTRIIEPGDQAYRILSGIVDAGVALYADPTVIGANRAQKVSNARHLFLGGDDVVESTGLIRGLYTRTVHGETVRGFLNGRVGTRIRRNIAEEPNGGELWRFLGRKMTPSELRPLRDATDAEQVSELLAPHLGRTFARTDEVWQEPNMFLKPVLESRWLTDMPTPYINLSDQEQVLPQTERWLRNLKADDATQNRFLDEMVSTAGDEQAILDVSDRMVAWSLNHVGFRSSKTRLRMFEKYKEQSKAAREALLDSATESRLLDEITLGDETLPIGNPFDQLAHHQQIVALPDPRELRRVGSKFNRVIAKWDDETKMNAPASALLWWQEQIWKPFTLLRAAWPVRVIPEEQARMAASDHAAMFKDPAEFVTWATTRRNDLLDTPFNEARKFEESLSLGSGGWAAEHGQAMRTGRQRIYTKTDDRYLDVAAENIAQLHTDDIGNLVARSSSLDEAEEFLLSPDGAESLNRLTRMYPKTMSEPGALRGYLEMTARHLRVKTGGNADLLDAVRTGQYKGKSIVEEGGLRVSREFRRALEGEDLFGALPEQAIGAEIRQFGGKRKGFVEWMFANLMGKPTNVLSRSPEFRQAYWERVEQMVSMAKPELHDALIESARRNLEVGPSLFGRGLGRKPIKRMAKTESRGTMTLEEIDEFAKGYALDDVQNLLYDLSKRSQIADSMRLVSPFGEAWREVITRWGTLLNPTTPRGVRNIHRAQQIIQAARGPDFGEVMGTDPIWDPVDEDWHQPGFFWKDEFGEEVFVYPGSQWLMNQDMRLPDWMPGVGGMGTPGIPVPLTGRVEGLNMIGSVFPGLGPVASVPVSWFLPDKPGITRTLREFMLPFGSVTEQGSASVLDLVNYTPPWMRTGLQALLGSGYDMNTNRIWANSTMATANYLYSTGRYDTTTTGGQQELMKDAKKAARNVYLIRSMLAFGAPAPPSPEFMVESNEGLIRLAILRDDYYEMLGDDPANADEKFLERWGELLADPGKDRVGMSMQSFTREVQGGVGVSQEWEDWANQHQDLKGDYSAIWAFFGPQEGKFDYDVYLRQILRGERQQLDLDEWMRFGQNHLGLMMKNHLEEQMPEDPTDEDMDWLDEGEAWIRENYPGYGDPTGAVERADRITIAHQIDRAYEADDSRIWDTPTGRVLREYWEARNEVKAIAEDMGLRNSDGILSGADALAADREWLYEVGRFRAEQDQGFKALWHRSLRSEVEPESEED